MVIKRIDCDATKKVSQEPYLKQEWHIRIYYKKSKMLTGQSRYLCKCFASDLCSTSI